MSNISRSKRAPSRAKDVRTEVERDTPSGLDEHLGYWLRFVSNHVSHAFEQKLARHGVTVAEWVVLRSLYGDDGIKPSRLSETIGLSRGAVSKLLDRLAAKDLVAIRGDTIDRRAQVVTLRPAGRKLVPKLASLADMNDREAFGHLEPEPRALLLSTLRGVVARLGLRAAPVD